MSLPSPYTAAPAQPGRRHRASFLAHRRGNARRVTDHGYEPFTIGVEEEFLLIDAETLELRPRAERVMEQARPLLGDRVQHEFNLAQIEIGSPVCSSLQELRDALRHLRRQVMRAAETTGSRIAATGTHPFSDWLGQQITPEEKYLRLEADYQQLAWEQLVCGCHVHVCVNDPEMAIRVMDRVRVWLAPILAIGANSPFWQGLDTGYASYRTEIYNRWPTTGTPYPLGDRATYEAVLEMLVATGSVDDPARLYWDVRPSARYDTLEFRVCDVSLCVEDAVLVAALCRALVRTCYRRAETGLPALKVRPELLQAARWRAARYGLDGELIDIQARRSVPAPAAVEGLLGFVRADLEEHGEWEEVREEVQRVLREGTGAHRQRQAHAREGSLKDVLRMVMDATVI